MRPLLPYKIHIAHKWNLRYTVNVQLYKKSDIIGSNNSCET